MLCFHIDSFFSLNILFVFSSSSSLSHHRKSCSLYINLQKSKEEPLDLDFSHGSWIIFQQYLVFTQIWSGECNWYLFNVVNSCCAWRDLLTLNDTLFNLSYKIWVEFIFVYQKSVKLTLKTCVWVQKYFLNWCSSVVNSQRLFCNQ